MAKIHEDIYSLIIQLLELHCNLGGVEGAKCIKLKEAKWLSVVHTLLKLATKEYHAETMTPEEIEAMVKWYLLNNSYELNATNPVNRSPSVNQMREIADTVAEILQKAGHLCSISKILLICTHIKEFIKKDHRKLLSEKYLILNRLQHGVSKLLEKSVDPEGLTKVLIG